MPTKKAVQEIVEELDVVENVVDKAVDGVDAVDHATHVAAVATKRGIRQFKNPQVIAFSVVGLSLAAGAGLGMMGYFLLKKRLQKQYEARLDKELEAMRTFYRRRYKTGQYATPETAAEAMSKYQDGDPRKDADFVPVKEEPNIKAVRDVAEEVETETVKEDNIFLNGRPINPMEWNLEVEESKRDPNFPYVISFEEFSESAFEHEQQNLTYYEGDDVLAEADDAVIENVDLVVGEDNLSRFGHGSKDRNVVYIRNERMERDFEVIRSMGKYAEEVHGLQHSDRPKKRQAKARWGDDE